MPPHNRPSTLYVRGPVLAGGVLLVASLLWSPSVAQPSGDMFANVRDRLEATREPLGNLVDPAAAEAIAAAESLIGTPYQYGGSSPQEGFDCSGLTMWAWGRAGAELPHSSAAQYEALPRVHRSELQPGDLVFFYNPIGHVGLYVGDGKMIDSPHTGTRVQRRPVLWDVYVGAVRPS